MNTNTTMTTKGVETYWPPIHEQTEKNIKQANQKMLGRIRELHDLDLEVAKKYGKKLFIKDAIYGSEFGKLIWQYLNSEITWDEVKDKIKQAFAYSELISSK